jgi:hypothetical protein
MNRLLEELKEMFFVLHVAAIDDGILYHPLPMSFSDHGISEKSEVMRRWNRFYTPIGSQLTGRLTGKVEGGKVFIEIEGPSIGEECLEIC